MRIGIVGPEERKFTPQSRQWTLNKIRELLVSHSVNGVKPIVISGHCPLGGVDIFAEQIAAELGLRTEIKAPKQHVWDAEYGYKQRNLDIARCSDKLYVFTVDKLPPAYNGMKFELCYHCGSTEHVKGGGCWTGKQAKRLGKLVEWIAVRN